MTGEVLFLCGTASQKGSDCSHISSGDVISYTVIISRDRDRTTPYASLLLQLVMDSDTFQTILFKENRIAD